MELEQKYELIIQTNEDARYFADELVAYCSGIVGSNRKGEVLARDFISTYNKRISLNEFYDKDYGEYVFFEIENTKGLYRGKDILFSEETYSEALLELKERHYNSTVKYIKNLEALADMEKNFFKRKRLKNNISIKKLELDTVRDKITHIPKFPAYDRIVMRFIDFNKTDLEIVLERAKRFASDKDDVTIVGFKLRTISVLVEDI